MKLVSVIVPIYNSERYLEECLNSIINQTYRNLEILLIDDGSTDSSAEICERYAQKDERIIVIHVENGGASKARNCGLDNANGEYIYFADSDDVYSNDGIEALVSCAEDNNADIVMGDYNEMDWNGGNITDPHEMERIIGQDDCKAISEETFWNYVTKCNVTVFPHSKLYHRRLWESNRFNEGMICEDHYVLPNIISSANSIMCLKIKLFCYRIHDGSVMHREMRFALSDAVIAHIKEIRYLLSKGFVEPCFDLCINAMRIMETVKNGVKMNCEEKIEFKKRHHNLCDVARELRSTGNKAFRLRTILFTYCFPICALIHDIRE